MSIIITGGYNKQEKSKWMIMLHTKKYMNVFLFHILYTIYQWQNLLSEKNIFF